MPTERSEQSQLKPVEEILAHIASRGHEIGLAESDLVTLQSIITGNGHGKPSEKFPKYIPERMSIRLITEEEIMLTSQENEFIACLWENKNRVTKSDILIKRVWGRTFATSLRDLHNLAVRTRKKVEPDPHHPQFIITYQNFGYLLKAEEHNQQEIAETESNQTKKDKGQRLQKAGFEYLPDQKVVRMHGRVEKLTVAESALMDSLYQHPDVVVHNEILIAVIKFAGGWDLIDKPNPSKQALATHIHRLRKKIEPNPQNPQFIQTWYGQGFLFNTYFHPFSHRPKH